MKNFILYIFLSNNKKEIKSKKQSNIQQQKKLQEEQLNEKIKLENNNINIKHYNFEDKKILGEGYLLLIKKYVILFSFESFG